MILRLFFFFFQDLSIKVLKNKILCEKKMKQLYKRLCSLARLQRLELCVCGSKLWGKCKTILIHPRRDCNSGLLVVSICFLRLTLISEGSPLTR